MKQNRLTLIIAHAAGWIFLFSLVAAFIYRTPNGNSPADFLSWRFILFCCIYLFIFYFNTYFLFPQFYLEKKYMAYGIVVVILLVLVWFIRPFDNLTDHFKVPPSNDFPRPGPPQPFKNEGSLPSQGRNRPQYDIIGIILFLTVWSLSTVICIIRQWRITEKRAIQAEADKANAELSFLKAQINPHFLFNTLNNIYSLALTNNEHTAASIMKLSNIMRYVTEDVREDFVSLKNEVECMTDYIDLQRMRLGKKTQVDFLISGDTENKKIAPLLLMTFIENAFKYGVSNHEPSVITIKLSAEKNSIFFLCSNKLFEHKKNTERTGIGIENTRQRLQYLYPAKHLLSISAEKGYYTAQLTLHL